MLKERLQKIISVILLTCLMFIGGTITSMAADIEESVEAVQPRLTYIVDAEADLSVVGTTATVDCRVAGHYSSATKAKVIAELQVKSSDTNWIPVAIWTDTQNGYRASVYETKTINPNNTYRVKATYTVWEGSQSETITVFTDQWP